jgi:tetratricopeptide (TPR) repeat protein
MVPFESILIYVQLLTAIILGVVIIYSLFMSIKGNEKLESLLGLIIFMIFSFIAINIFIELFFNEIDYINVIACLIFFSFIIYLNRDYFYRGIFDRKFRKAIKLDKKGDYDDAFKIYNELVIEGKKYPVLYYNISIILFRNGEFKDALSYINKTLKIKPNDKKSILFKGNILEYIDSYEEALKCYDKVLKKDMFDNNASKGKIKSLINLNREKEALTLIDNILKSDKNDLELMELKSFAFLNMGEYENSLKCLNKILSENENDSKALLQKSIILMNLNEYKQSSDVLDNYLNSIDSDDKWSESFYWDVKCSLCSNFNKEKGLEACDKSLLLMPDKIHTLIYKIGILNELNKKDELKKCAKKTLKLINKKLKLNTQNVGLLLDKAEMYIYLKKCDSASEIIESIKIDPNDKYSLNNKGVLLRKLGRFDEAMENLDQALKIFPNSVDFLWNKAYLLDKMDKFDEALEFYDKALKIAPNKKELQEDKEKLLEKIK